MVKNIKEKKNIEEAKTMRRQFILAIWWTEKKKMDSLIRQLAKTDPSEFIGSFYV